MKLTASSVPLSKLIRSPLNVRKHGTEIEDVSDLQPSIAESGLLNPITVHALKKPKGKYGVLAGARRWQALVNLSTGAPLVDSNLDFAAIPVMIAEGTDAELVEASLVENTQRADMSDFDTWEAFNAVRAADPSVLDEDLARRFDLTVKDVRQIMRLGIVHPEILAAYRDKQIGKDVVRAYGSTDDQARQLAVWEAHKDDRYFYAHNVRAALGFTSGHDVKSKLALVGADVFSAAGGKIATDMFSDAIEITGTDILDALFDEKVEGLKQLYLAEHPKVTLVTDDSALPRGQYGSRDWDLRINLDSGRIPVEDRPRWDALGERLEAIDEDLAQHIDYDQVNEDEEFVVDPATWPYVEAFDSKPLLEERAEVVAQIQAITPETGIPDVPLLGLFSIAGTKLEVQLYYPSREAAGLQPLERTTARESIGGTDGESAHAKDRLRWGLTKDNMGAMMVVKRDMVRDQLLNDHELALDFLLFSQGYTILHPGKDYSGAPTHSGMPVGIETIPSEDSSHSKPPSKMRQIESTITRAGHLAATIALLACDGAFTAHDPMDGFMIFRSRSDSFKAQVAAVIAGFPIKGAGSYYSDPVTPRMIEFVAAEYLGSGGGIGRWQDSVTFDAAFFGTINHKKRLLLLDSWGQADRAKTLKSAESAAFCARVYAACVGGDDELERDRGLLGINEEDASDIVSWLPEWLDPSRPKPLPKPKGETDELDAIDKEVGECSECGGEGHPIEHDVACSLADDGEDARRQADAIAEAKGDATTLEGDELAVQE